MILEHRSKVSILIFEDVDGDVFSGDRVFVFTYLLLPMIREALDNSFDIMCTHVLFAELCIHIVQH